MRTVGFVWMTARGRRAWNNNRELSVRTVSIVGAGMTPFGAFPERNIEGLAREAGRECLESADCEPDRLDALYVGNFAGPSFTGRNHLAPWIASGLGLTGVPATRVEAACASSGAAFYQAWAAVAGGVADCALVIGVEQMSTATTEETATILAAAGDVEREAAEGATFPALFGLIAQRYLYEHRLTRDCLAATAVKNHAHGMLNPRAHMRKPITMEKALGARMIADPLGLYDCSLISDGAAAVLLTAEPWRPDPVRVRGLGMASDRLALADKPSVTTFPAVRRAAEKAYQAAGVEAGDVDFAELHDCFTVAELIAAEDLGFFRPGEAARATLDDATSRDGRLPINASGGLKSKGHPVGATGTAQIAEAYWQLRGEAGDRQLGSARVGLTQNLGGSGATAVVGVFSL